MNGNRTTTAQDRSPIEISKSMKEKTLKMQETSFIRFPPTSHRRISGFQNPIRKQPCAEPVSPRNTITAAQLLGPHVNTQRLRLCEGHKISSTVVATQTNGKPRRLKPSRSKRNRCTQPAKRKFGTTTHQPA